MISFHPHGKDRARRVVFLSKPRNHELEPTKVLGKLRNKIHRTPEEPILKQKSPLKECLDMKTCVKQSQAISLCLLHTKSDIWYSELMINSSKGLQGDWAWQSEDMFIPSLYCTSLYCFCPSSVLIPLLVVPFIPPIIFKLMAYCLYSVIFHLLK